MPRQQIRRVLLLAGLLLLPSAGRAQWIRLADNTTLIVIAPQPSIVGAFPPWWRDSVAAVWVRNFTGKDHRPERPLPPGVRATLALQILRDGKLRRARIGQTTSDVRLDSALIATSWEVVRSGGYPKFPAGVEGAGTEVELLVTTPVRGWGTAGRADTDPLAGVGELPPLAGGCESTLAVPNQVAQLTLRAILDSSSGEPARTQWATRALTAMQPEFRPQGILTSTSRPRLFFEESRIGRTLLSGLLRFAVDSTGRLIGAEMVVPSGYPALDSILVAMVRAADSANALPPPPPGAPSTSVDVRFETDRGETHRGVPLGVATFGAWGLDAQPRVTSVGRQYYPPELFAAGIGGRVELEFVVGADGRVIPASVQIVSAPHPALADAATRSIRETVFRPATAKGCAVPTLFRQRMNFRAN
jgi:TonB family protein